MKRKKEKERIIYIVRMRSYYPKRDEEAKGHVIDFESDDRTSLRLEVDDRTNFNELGKRFNVVIVPCEDEVPA